MRTVHVRLGAQPRDLLWISDQRRQPVADQSDGGLEARDQ
jgi:hypothetical protein